MDTELIECLEPDEVAKTVELWGFLSWVIYKYDGFTPRGSRRKSDEEAFDNLVALGLASGTLKFPKLTPKSYYYSLRVHAWERSIYKFKNQYRQQDNWQRMINDGT